MAASNHEQLKMSNAFRIEIFCPSGDPENMRIVTKKGWTGEVYYVTRDYWADGIAEYRDKLTTPGVYVLVGSEEENNDDGQRIYIGQTENLVQRVESHMERGERAFDCIICVTGADFYGAGSRWMESNLINRAREIDRCILWNNATPKTPELGKPEESDLKRFLAETMQIFPLVDVKAFTDPKKIKPVVNTSTSDAQDGSPQNNNGLRINSSRNEEVRNQVMSVFQSNKKVELFKVNKTKFYDASHKFRVCCSVSKKYSNYGRYKNDIYWFSPTIRQLEFLEKAEDGYFLFCLAEESKAICLSVSDFKKVKDDKNSQLDRETNEIVKWFLTIEINGDRFILPRINNTDITEYTFDIT